MDDQRRGKRCVEAVDWGVLTPDPLRVTISGEKPLPDLTGLWATTVTPFRSDGTVDLETVRRHVSFLVTCGVERLVPAGNTGEFSSLTADEIVAVVRATREAAPGALVYAGVGGALPVALELTAETIAAGADGLLVHHPSHTHMGRAGLDVYYRRLAAAAYGSVFVYKRSHRVPDALAVALAREGVVRGVKYAVNDLLAFQRAQEAAPNAAWICGTAELWAPFFHLLGACGFTSGLVNAAPRLSVALEHALREGDLSRTMELRALARDFEELRAEDDAAKNVPAVRAAMGLAGFPPGPPRPPLARLEEADERRVAAVWAAWSAAGVAGAPDRVAR
jgi:4-hydroxy-tetrahydrodipicolinate synthase